MTAPFATVPLVDPVDSFGDDMAANGFDRPREIIADGKIHRFGSDGKPGKKSYWYVLYPDGIAAGAYGDWREGEDNWHKWCSRAENSLSEDQRKVLRLRMEAARRAREVEIQKHQADAAALAENTWEQSAQVFERCPEYLTVKGVQSHGLRVTTRKHAFPCTDGEHRMPVGAGALVVSVRDADGKLTSLQFIDGEGKRFLPGGRVRGCFHVIGEIEGAKRIGIAEGYATAASIHEATGLPVVVAFFAGNLEPVAESLRAKYPRTQFVFGADDDHLRENNSGITKATEAAKKFGGIVAIPDFGVARGKDDTDWNDLAKAKGLEVVKTQIEKAIAATVPPLASSIAVELWARPLPPPVLTPFAPLNDLLGGGLRGLNILAGPTGRGKTGLGLQMARATARLLPVCYFSTELSDRQALARLAAQELSRPWRPMYEGSAPTGLVVAHALAPLNLRVVVINSVTQFLDSLRSIEQFEGQPPFVVLDYLQGLARNPEEDRRLAVGALSEAITAWSRTTGGVVLAVSSISRANYFNTDAKSAGDFVNAAKESGDIDYDASSVLFLDVGAPPLGGKAEGRLHVAKSRFGTLGTVGVVFDGPTGTFEEDPTGGLTEDQRAVYEAIMGGAKTWDEIQEETGGMRRQKIGPAIKALQARQLIGSRPPDGGKS
jgi:phage/plasmid primase-like uncharacterized protein